MPRPSSIARCLALGALALVARPTPAHAIAACNNNEGFAPATGTTVPPHARLVYYTDHWRDPAFVATLDGKAVKVKVTELPSGSSTRLVLLEIDSAKTGTLKVGIGTWTALTLKVAKAVASPKEVPVTIGRFQQNIQHSTVKEDFDGLAIRLPANTPAISAHVKLRRDGAGAWTELEVPVSPRDFDDPRPVIRIGQLGCTQNYSVALLNSGVDIEATLTLVDGTTRPAKDLAAHLTLPPVLPKQPVAPQRRP
jgi:hypothetical protein